MNKPLCRIEELRYLNIESKNVIIKLFVETCFKRRVTGCRMVRDYFLSIDIQRSAKSGCSIVVTRSRQQQTRELRNGDEVPQGQGVIVDKRMVSQGLAPQGNQKQWASGINQADFDGGSPKQLVNNLNLNRNLLLPTDFRFCDSYLLFSDIHTVTYLPHGYKEHPFFDF